jgi:hypothetical protein
MLVVKSLFYTMMQVENPSKVENITKLGQVSEPEEFRIAHFFLCVWKLTVFILIMMILLAEHSLFQTLLCSDKHIFHLV